MANTRHKRVHYLTWSFSILVFMLISVITFFIHKDTERKIDDQFSSTQMVLAKIIGNEIKLNADILIKKIESVTHNSDVIDADMSNLSELIKNNINEVILFGNVYSVIFIDANGEILYSFPDTFSVDELRKDYDFSLLTKYETALKKHNAVIGDIKDYRSEKERSATLFIPLSSSKNEYKGAFGVLVNISAIRDSYLKFLDVQHSYDLFILNESGENMDSVIKDWLGIHFYGSNNVESMFQDYVDLPARVLAEPENTIKVDFRAVAPNKATVFLKKFVTFKQVNIANRKWRIVISTPYKEISFLLNKNFQYIVIILAILLIFILSISYILLEINKKRIVAEESEMHLRTEGQLKKELVISEEKYKSIMDEALEGIALFKGIEIMEVNNAWAKMYGVKKDECLGLSIYDVIHHESVSLIKDFIIGSDQQNDSSLFNKDVFIVTGRGEKRTHNISMCKLSNSDQLMTCLIARDVTERRKEEQELVDTKKMLEKANAELDFYISSIVHDIKNPLVAVQGFIGLLIDEISFEHDEKKDSYLNKIQKNISHIFNLLESLLELSKIGRVKKVIQRIELQREIGRIKDYLSPIIEESQAEIKIVNELQIIYSDRTLITQILSNLINNAIKFRRDGVAPLIEIGSRDLDNYIEFFIKDNGVGIKEKDHDVIFKIFGRVSTGKSIAGSGVGLNITKKAVNELGGELRFESEYEKGTTFYFTIPKEKSYFFLQKLRKTKI